MDEKKLKTPSLEILRMELAKEESRYEFRRTFFQVAGILAVAAAITAFAIGYGFIKM